MTTRDMGGERVERRNDNEGQGRRLGVEIERTYETGTDIGCPEGTNLRDRDEEWVSR